MDGVEEVCNSAKLYVVAVWTSRIENQWHLWKVTGEHVSMQMPTAHIRYSVSAYLGKWELFEMTRSVTADQWSGNWQEIQNIDVIGFVLAAERGAVGSFLSRSVVQRKDACKCMFAVLLKGTEEVIL